MNRNSIRTKVKVATCCLAGVVALGGSSFVSSAATSAGSMDLLSAATETQVSGTSTNAGVSASLADCLTNVMNESNAAAAEEVQVAENEAPVVQSEFANIGVSNIEEDSYINIRSEASTESEVVGKLYYQSAVTVVGMEGEWYHITSGNCEGYIKAEYIITGDEELAESISRRVAIVEADILNIRDDKTAEGTLLGQVEQGDQLLVAEETDGWVRVYTEEGEGFVSSDYVTCENHYKVAETREEEEARLEQEERARRAANLSTSNRSSSSNDSSGDTGSAPTYNPPSGGSGQAVADFAVQFVGCPYVYGGSSLTNGADCSGFVMAVYAQFGVSLPHQSGAMQGVGYGVSVDSMQPGDIVCYSGHVGIYIGGGCIVHASDPSSGIKVSSAYYSTILAVRRIF